SLRLRALASFLSTTPPPPRSTLFPYTTLFRSEVPIKGLRAQIGSHPLRIAQQCQSLAAAARAAIAYCERMGDETEPIRNTRWLRSEEHTSELQSLTNLVCRLLLEKKKHTRHTNGRDRKSVAWSTGRLFDTRYVNSRSSDLARFITADVPRVHPLAPHVPRIHAVNR